MQLRFSIALSVLLLICLRPQAQRPELPLIFTNQFPCQSPGVMLLKKVQYLTFKPRQHTSTVYPDGVIPLKKIAFQPEPRIPAMMEFNKNGHLIRAAVYQADGDAYRLSTLYYDDQGRALKVVESLRRLVLDAEAAYDSTSYHYNPAGQLDSIIPAPSGKLSRGKDSRPIQRKQVLQYNETGKLQRIQVLNWGGSLRWADPGPNLESQTHFEYDLQNRLIRMTDGDSLRFWETSYKYNEKGRLFSEVRITPAGKKERIISYLYDEKGRLVYMKTQRIGKATRTALFTYREDGLLDDFVLEEEKRTLVNAVCEYQFYPPD